MSLLQRGTALRPLSNSFTRFHRVVEDYDEFDVGVKNAILKASSSVASLISHTGDKVVFIGSGTIIECEEQDGNFFGTILTSATLLRGPSGVTPVPCNVEIDVYLSDGKLYEGQVFKYDFHHNIAVIKIKSTAPLSTATIRYVDDSMTIDLTKSAVTGSHSFQQASSMFNLCPGELVIALGRFFKDPYEIMASPGVFSAFDCCYDCKELFLTSCTVTKVAVGGPLVNCHGEVVGVNFYACPFNAFLPINVASKCLEYLKRNRQVPRPWLGVGIANLYMGNLSILEKLKEKFPHVIKGVIVEEVGKKKSIKSRTKRMKVERKSPASGAGLCAGDVIGRCDGIPVGSHLEFTDALWEKEGKPVELVVLRPSVGEQLNLTVMIKTSPQENRWRVPANGDGPILSFPYHF